MQELRRQNSDLQKELDTTKEQLLDAQSASSPGMDPSNLNLANDFASSSDDLQCKMTQKDIEEMIKRMDSEDP